MRSPIAKGVNRSEGRSQPPPLHFRTHQEIPGKKMKKGGGQNKWKGDVHGKSEGGMKRLNK